MMSKLDPFVSDRSEVDRSVYFTYTGPDQE